MGTRFRSVSRSALLGAAIALSGCATVPRAASPAPFPLPSPDARPLTEAASPTTAVLTRALALQGTPYRLGGDTPETGLDCSGLVRYAFLGAQASLPRTVAEQFRVGQAVNGHDIRPGDLLFFDTFEPGPSHVGIAVDGDTFVHAPGSGGFVRLDRIAAPYWTARLRGVRRLLVAPAAAAPAVGQDVDRRDAIR